MFSAAVEDQDASLFAGLERQPPDPLLQLIGAYNDDTRQSKIDLGIGVYRDAAGLTPVMAAVKAAEGLLLREQATKAYLGPEGDTGFLAGLKPIVLGEAADDRWSALQTPGGTGALRLAADLVATARPGARIFMGTPSWANHAPILGAGGLEIISYPCFDVASQTLRFDVLLEALGGAAVGDVALLQVCCHNPVGADLDRRQWDDVARLMARRRIVPLLDFPYQGLAEGLEADAYGVRAVCAQVPEALVAYSCDKNFGLYRERTGALFALSANSRAAAITLSNLFALARANWSMPPDHGAAVVRTVLEHPDLRSDWLEELERMRSRIAEIRIALAQRDPALAALARQHGMFSTLPLSPDQIARLRTDHGIYMAGSGRINVAGLNEANIPAFAAALAACR